MKVTVKMEGLSQLDAALGELGKAAGKAVLRRVGKMALEPMRATAERLAPDDPTTGPPDLHTSVRIGTKLTRRQARLASKDARQNGKDTVVLYMGPNDPAAVPQEFGTFDQPPQPFMRPAFDAHARETIDIIGRELGNEIDKTAKRQAARAARLAAKG